MDVERPHNAYLLGFLAGKHLSLQPQNAIYPVNPYPPESDDYLRWDDGFGDAILNRGPLANVIPESIAPDIATADAETKPRN